MSKLDEILNEFAKPASSVKHSRKIAYVVSRADIVELNSTIEAKIRQNKSERESSWSDGKNKNVK